MNRRGFLAALTLPIVAPVLVHAPALAIFEVSVSYVGNGETMRFVEVALVPTLEQRLRAQRIFQAEIARAFNVPMELIAPKEVPIDRAVVLQSGACRPLSSPIRFRRRT